MRPGWVEKAFDDVLVDCTGGNAKTLQSEYLSNGEFAVVDQGQELIAGFVNDSQLICKAMLPAIIFGDHTRIFKYADFPFCLGADGVKVLRPKIEADARFLFHQLRSFEIPEAGYSRHFKFLKRMRIALPPLEEQRRIAAILDKADALRQKRRIALQTLDSLTQSIFLDMFGDQARSRGEWPTVSFRNIATFTTGKLDSNASVVGGTYPFFTCSRDDFFIDVYAFDCEALLLAGNNAAGEYSVKHYNGKFNAYQRTYVIQVDPSICTFQYMRLALSAKLSELKHLSKGTGTRYLTLEILHRLQFSLPPYSLQKDFGFKLSRLQDQRSRLERGISHFGDLFTSLQHRAFRGEL